MLVPSNDVIVFPPLDRVLKPLAGMLLVVVALVLVIACANLAGFLLARAVDRRKEIAVRLALGATRRQLVSQLLVETVLLALAGGALGLILGRVALRLVLSSSLPFPLPISLALAVDGRVLGFSLLVSVAAGVLFGLVPALQSTRLDLASVIRDETVGGGRTKGTIRGFLVGGQVAVSMVGTGSPSFPGFEASDWPGTFISTPLGRRPPMSWSTGSSRRRASRFT